MKGTWIVGPMVGLLGVTLLALQACGDSTPPPAGICEAAAERVGKSVCVEKVADATVWQTVTKTTASVDQVRTTRYVMPAHADARIPLVFEDQRAGFMNHYHFLRTAFAAEFADVDYMEYSRLITAKQGREFYGGAITEWRPLNDGPHVLGAVIWDEQTANGTITCAEAQAVATALTARAPSPVAIVIATSYQRAEFATCDVATVDPSLYVPYEAYTKRVGYGTVARLRLAEVQPAIAQGLFTWRNVLVIDEAPIDVETIVSGVVTGTRQGELSHLNVRAASRGTPNCYVRDAYQKLAPWDGKLVRMECTDIGLQIRDATPAEAEEHWRTQLRPPPLAIATPDDGYANVENVLQLDTSTSALREQNRRRVGGKAGQLATLYQRIDADLRYDAMAIPFRYYQAFVRANGLDTKIAAIVDDVALNANPAMLRARLTTLQAEFEAGSCVASDVDTIATALAARWAPTTMVRFRSSSNAEDSLAFNGAGLYESTNACIADERDGDVTGPSRCDGSIAKERDVCRALKKVWASLWLARAYEERAFYGIDHRKVRMAVLVNDRSADEAANAVVFTGNPVGPDHAPFLLNAQHGDLEVVSAEPGVWPEKVLLTLANGQVTGIRRVRASSEQNGAPVLSDRELQTLGAALARIDLLMPRDEAPPAGKRVIWDTEWKKLASGRLVIKQIRPFLDAP